MDGYHVLKAVGWCIRLGVPEVHESAERVGVPVVRIPEVFPILRYTNVQANDNGNGKLKIDLLAAIDGCGCRRELSVAVSLSCDMVESHFTRLESVQKRLTSSVSVFPVHMMHNSLRKDHLQPFVVPVKG